MVVNAIVESLKFGSGGRGWLVLHARTNVSGPHPNSSMRFRIPFRTQEEEVP